MKNMKKINMNKSFLAIALTFSVFCISGCIKQKPPDCSDEQTKELVKQIVDDYYNENFQSAPAGTISYYLYLSWNRNNPEELKSMKQKIHYTLDAITTEGYDKEANRYSCSARFVAEIKLCDKAISSSEKYIKYSSYLTDDGYQMAEVFGLNNSLANALIGEDSWKHNIYSPDDLMNFHNCNAGSQKVYEQDEETENSSQEKAFSSPPKPKPIYNPANSNQDKKTNQAKKQVNESDISDILNAPMN